MPRGRGSVAGESRSTSPSASGTSFIARFGDCEGLKTVDVDGVLPLSSIEHEREMDGSKRRHRRGTIDQDADLDLAGRDHLDIDPSVGKRMRTSW